MGNALAEVQLPDEVVRILRKYFEDTATFMINHAD